MNVADVKPPKTWPIVKLSELCETTQGTQIAKSEQSKSQRPNYRRYLYISDLYSDSEIKFVKDEHPTKIVTENDLIVANTGSPGRVFRGVPGILSNNLFKVSFDQKKLNRDFLFEILSSDAFQAVLQNQMKQGIQRHLGHKTFGRQVIPLPPLSEQKRIAEILDRAEALRAKRRTALALLNELTQSIFLDMFGDPASNEFGWDCVKVAEAGRVQLGRQRAPKYQSGKFTRPYIRVANVYENRLALHDVLSMDFNDADFKAYRLEHGDILLNEGQSTELVGRPAMWRNEIADCCYQNTLVRFQCQRKTTLPEFALALFLYYFRRGEFAKISSKTSSVAHLGATRFGLMPFILPPLDVQRTFVKRIECLDRTKGANAKALSELDALFASLQHRAFRGEL